MSGITLRNIHSAGGVINATPPVQDWWSIDNELVVCKGDTIKPHGKRPHDTAKISEGTDWFTIDGNPVCNSGKKATCLHVANGSDWWFID